MVVAAGSAKLVLLLTARLNSRKPVTIRRVCSTSGTRATCSTSALATWGARGRRARAQRSCARPHSREGCTCSLDREALARALRGAVRTHKLVSVEHAQRYAERVGIPTSCRRIAFSHWLSKWPYFHHYFITSLVRERGIPATIILELKDMPFVHSIESWRCAPHPLSILTII